MTAAKTWVAAGSTAAVLAGSLVLGAPAAVAAPDDAACLQASGQFNGALAAVGITAVSLTEFERLAGAAATAQANYEALVQTAAGDVLVQLETALAELEAAEAAGDTTGAAAAQARIAGLETQLAAAIATPEIAAAEQAVLEAATALEALLMGLSLDENSATQLLGLFKQFLVACEGVGGEAPVVAPGTPSTPVAQPVVAPVDTTPPPPVEAAPVTVAPAPLEAAPVAAPAPAVVEAAPVAAPAAAPAPVVVEAAPVAAPAAAPSVVEAAPVAAPAPAPVVVEAAPVAVNPGMNVQTAAGDREEHPGTALLTALLAAGIAVPAAAAVRLRRLARSRP
ncbi:hypothetical protein GCM10011374_13530 [Kocuria dechangensis]|uniref:Uncharacterized protein n=1 Tax=Kocuria dechangensis TaxID=1176249 RepID=A0A917LQT0_9MICC|nr:hypothetical protein [Kocuria dechangensis]GGG52105.1 hypothetical protein GCM10011374_13530 [Kocuria dechangensis]